MALRSRLMRRRVGQAWSWLLPAGPRARLAAGLLLLALNLVLANLIVARQGWRMDWTAARIFSLSPKSMQILGSLSRPVRIVLFMVPPGDRGQESLYYEVRELVDQLARSSAQITVEEVAVDADPARARLLAKKYEIAERDLREGVIVVQADARSKYVTASSMATYQITPAGRQLTAFYGERALLEALLLVSRGQAPTVCFAQGHGEADPASYEPLGLGLFASEVRRDGYQLQTLSPEQLIAGASGCQVVLFAGPVRALATLELDAVDRYLRRGGRLLVLLGPVLDRKAARYRSIGLEPLLARWGAQPQDNIVVDPLAVPGEQALLTWATRDGYGAHPIAQAMEGRLTVWPLTREIRPRPDPEREVEAVTLVQTSGQGWGETDLASLHGERTLQPDPAVDTPGPVPVAVAAASGQARLVVLGSERGVLNERLGGRQLRDDNRELVLAALAWVAGQQAQVAVGAKRPEHLRLLVDQQQLQRIFLCTVVAMPALSLLWGVVCWWRRRR